MRTFWIIQHFARFRREMGLLWQAFRNPVVPWHLKALMLLVPLYLVSPIDLIPDVIPVLGWLDDLVIVPMLVSMISRLVARHMAGAEAARGARRHESGIIDGEWRRL